MNLQSLPTRAVSKSLSRCAMAAIGLLVAFNANAFLTLGQTSFISPFEFKWGDSNQAGTPGGTVSYSFLPDRTDCSRLLQSEALGRSCLTDDAASTFGLNYESIFANAFDAWSQWANIDFVQVADDGSPSGRDGLLSSTGSIRIGASRYDQRVLGFASARFDRSVGGKGLDGDILLNGSFRSDFNHNPTFLLGLALHEIGHSLGLAHSNVFPSVMSQFGELLSELRPDDIAGIQFIYGARTANEVPEPSGLALSLAALALLAAIRRNKQPA